ncbi:MAG: hypothetical protein ACREBH_03855 [Candidatus Micrarchaeaceae archaeon]
MARENRVSISAVLALASGFVTLLYSFYIMQKLSYSIGIYSGIGGTIKAFNITSSSASNTLSNSISQLTTLVLALHISYALLPFAVVILAIGIIWLFGRTYFKPAGLVLVIISAIYIAILTILEFDFSLTNTSYLSVAAYLGAALALAVGIYAIARIERPHVSARRPMHPISINPETPYSNMKLLSKRLMRNLSGSIKIIDMHFDINALDNMMQLIGSNMQQYKSISVITASSRLGDKFGKSYTDSKNELSNKGIAFELRVLGTEDAAKQHERILMDDSTAYKIPPLNIINKKSEHIVGINYKEAEYRFNSLWSKATKYENLRAP